MTTRTRNFVIVSLAVLGIGLGTGLVAYYLQALVTHEMPQDSAVSMLMQVFREVPSVAVSLLSLGVIVAVALWQAGRAVEQREYVLEQ